MEETEHPIAARAGAGGPPARRRAHARALLDAALVEFSAKGRAGARASARSPPAPASTSS